MADTGAPFELPFPEPASLVRDAPQAFEDLADKIVDYLLLTETGPQTANYTLALSDVSRVVAMNSTSARTVTIPANATVAFPVGTVIGLYNMNTGLVTVAGASGVTVRNAGQLEQFREVSIRKRGVDEWVVAGL
jgi:hypothetical protein